MAEKMDAWETRIRKSAEYHAEDEKKFWRITDKEQKKDIKNLKELVASLEKLCKLTHKIHVKDGKRITQLQKEIGRLTEVNVHNI